MTNSRLLSTISCEKRGDLCEDLNPDKVNIVYKPWLSDPFGNINLKNSFFHKNEYGLEDEIKTVYGLNKEDCANIALDNNYAGFIYYGDKNKCYQYNTDNFNSPIDNDLLNNYDVETFFRTKSTSSIDKHDQHNYDKYFTPIQTMGFVPSKYSNSETVPNKIKCMEGCVKNIQNCNAIMYNEKPKKCVFYKKKVMKNKLTDSKLIEGDIYTVIINKLQEHNTKMNELNKKIIEKGDLNFCSKLNNRCVFERIYETTDSSILNSKDELLNNLSNIKNGRDSNVPLYNCNGLYSTNPFCTKEYNALESIESNDITKEMYYTDCFEIDSIKNQVEKKKFLSQLCSDKYGKEYIFDDNIFNMNSILKCDDGKGKKGLCKMNFDQITKPFITDKIEHFNNNSISSTDKNTKSVMYNANMFKTIVLLLLFFVIIYLTYNVLYKC